MFYYGTKISDNISVREPEGYLLCLNVPVARTGYQDYLPEEIGISGVKGCVSVYRPEDEVFSPECIASFEGMPITNDHPDEGVSVENIRSLGMGHVQNVRRGVDEESDLLMADLLIQDPDLIDLILNKGKREISCGYTYELDFNNGKYIQRKIRGNHVAVVDAGRAGHRVSIKDHAIVERRNFMKKSLAKKLCKMARDGDPEAMEAITELTETILENPEIPVDLFGELPAEVPVENSTVSVKETVTETQVSVDPAQTEENSGNDEASIADVIERLDRIIDLLSNKEVVVDEDPVEEIVEAVEEAVEGAVVEAVSGETTPEVAVAEAVEEISEAVGEEVDPMSTVIDPSQEDQDPQVCGNKTSSDTVRAVLSAMRPMLAKMPKKQRQKFSADIAAFMKKSSGNKSSSYAKLAAARDSKGTASNKDLAHRIMSKRNPNYHK